MPKPSKEMELVAKSEQFKTYKEKVDKLLCRLASERAQLVSCNNTEEEEKQLLMLEIECAKKVKEIDEIAYHALWNYDGSFDKILTLLA